jgi:hypothetical protein
MAGIMPRENFGARERNVLRNGSLWTFCLILMTAVVIVVSAADAYTCSRASPVSNVEMVKQADAIVRVTAVEYARPPRDPSMWTTGLPDSTVRFKGLEVIRGQGLRRASQLILPGYPVDHDDYNDQALPYNFVRPNGRSGSCFANSYRRGGQFLLILKQQSPGYTANWYALGPTNEQLHSSDDPWLAWVREQAKVQTVPTASSVETSVPPIPTTGKSSPAQTGCGSSSSRPSSASTAFF